MSLHALVFGLALCLVTPKPPASPPLPLHWPTLRLGQSGTRSGPGHSLATPHRPAAVRPRTAQALAPTLQPTAAEAPRPTAAALPGPGGPGPGEGPGASDCPAPGCPDEGPGRAEGTILTLGPEMVAPRLLSGSLPRYPAAALSQQLGGTVVVRCAVTDKGHVEDCTVLQSVPLLDEAALEAVRGRRYAPAVYAGQPVSVWMTVPVRFVVP